MKIYNTDKYWIVSIQGTDYRISKKIVPRIYKYKKAYVFEWLGKRFVYEKGDYEKWF